MYNKEILKKYLNEILNIPSPTGYTHEIVEYIKKDMDNLNVPYIESNKGGLLITIQGENNEYQKTFAGHVDTLGAMVKGIKANTRLELTQIGGYMMQSIEGETCKIHTRNKKVYEGTIQTIKPSVHIHGQDARELARTPQNYEVVIDEVLNTKDDVYNLGIEVGDFVSLETRTKITDTGFIKSRYLDDKASVAAMLFSIRYMVENNIKPKNTINFFMSNYEEVGHGACSGIPCETKEIIAVDMGCPGDGQNSTEYDICICAKDSNGPYDYNLTNELINVCKENNINHKVDIYPNYGSDATAALKSGLDAKFALIGPGIYASHGYERTHLDSIVATIDLIIKYSQV